ncbi:MAG: DUF1080 domain-containing protein [Planctomyces sp.]
MPRRLLIQSCCLLALIGFSSRFPARGEDAVSSPQNATEKSNSEFESLFDGNTFDRWQGDEKWFRVEDRAIVGGSLNERIPHNFFLSSEAIYDDFELTLEFRLKGDQTNAGIQLRSQRIPGHHEMIGYQADLGQSYWGCLYDESRRNRILAAPEPQKIAAVLKKEDWNSYRILCEGARIRLWINDLQTVDYTEVENEIPQTGHIALQIHGGPPGEAWYRNIRLRRLSARTE